MRSLVAIIEGGIKKKRKKKKYKKQETKFFDSLKSTNLIDYRFGSDLDLYLYLPA